MCIGAFQFFSNIRCKYRALTVTCQRCLHFLSLSYTLYTPLISGIHLLDATYSLPLISCYSISACDNFSYFLFSSFVYESHPSLTLSYFNTSLHHLPEPPIFLCVQSLFASLLALLFSLSSHLASLPVPHNFYICHYWPSSRSLLRFNTVSLPFLSLLCC